MINLLDYKYIIYYNKIKLQNNYNIKYLTKLLSLYYIDTLSFFKNQIKYTSNCNKNKAIKPKIYFWFNLFSLYNFLIKCLNLISCLLLTFFVSESCLDKVCIPFSFLADSIKVMLSKIFSQFNFIKSAFLWKLSSTYENMASNETRAFSIYFVPTSLLLLLLQTYKQSFEYAHLF